MKARDIKDIKKESIAGKDMGSFTYWITKYNTPLIFTEQQHNDKTLQ